MIFSTFFEISLTILGFLYVSNMWFDSFIYALEVNKEIAQDESEKQADKEREQLCKHLYS